MHALIVNKHEQQKQRVVLEKRYKLPKRNIYKMVTLSIQFISKYSFFFRSHSYFIWGTFNNFPNPSIQTQLNLNPSLSIELDF